MVGIIIAVEFRISFLPVWYEEESLKYNNLNFVCSFLFEWVNVWLWVSVWVCVWWCVWVCVWVCMCVCVSEYWSLILKEENTKNPTAWWECAQEKERKEQEDRKNWIIRSASIIILAKCFGVIKLGVIWTKSVAYMGEKMNLYGI
jgi:hypothetical protein